MGRGIVSLTAVAALAGVLAFNSSAVAQTAAAPTENAAPTADNAVMLTIFLKHDQSRPLSELNAQLEKQGFYKAFPPPGIEVVSWYIMMGIGQVVTLRLPASRLREVNRILENTAWGSYRTEFYPTYDYKAVGIAAHAAYWRTRPGAAIALSSIRLTTTRRSASGSTTRRSRARNDAARHFVGQLALWRMRAASGEKDPGLDRRRAIFTL